MEIEEQIQEEKTLIDRISERNKEFDSEKKKAEQGLSDLKIMEEKYPKLEQEYLQAKEAYEGKNKEYQILIIEDAIADFIDIETSLENEPPDLLKAETQLQEIIERIDSQYMESKHEKRINEMEEKIKHLRSQQKEKAGNALEQIEKLLEGENPGKNIPEAERQLQHFMGEMKMVADEGELQERINAIRETIATILQKELENGLTENIPEFEPDDLESKPEPKPEPKPKPESTVTPKTTQELKLHYKYGKPSETYREHSIQVSSKRSKKTGDALKREILENFRERLKEATKENFDNTVKQIKNDADYKILEKAQRRTTRYLSLDTSSVTALKKMIDERSKQLFNRSHQERLKSQMKKYRKPEGEQLLEGEEKLLRSQASNSK